MKKLFIVTEGETEELFVKKVIRPHLQRLGMHAEAQQWITNRKLGTGGGGGNFDLIENHIRRLMSRYQHDQTVFISVMVDLYAFPKQGNSVFDDTISKIQNGKDKVLRLEDRLKERMAYRNFIPYVQLYEFETLLLSKPDALSVFYTDKKKEIEALADEVSGMNPEDINDTPEGAPSRRIIKHILKYEKQKTSAGVITAEKIGLPHLRATCSHFNDWITKLERL